MLREGKLKQNTKMKNIKIKKHNPLVSVIMPIYNEELFLQDAIESILAQTYTHFELILINDASTDSSLSIMQSYKKRFPERITILNLKKTLNKGGDSCANKGLEIAKGNYIARMDSDDVAHPTRLAKQVTYLENNPSVFLVGSNAHVIDAKGKIIGEKNEPLTHAEIYANYFTYHPIIHPSAMYRRLYKGVPFSYKLKFSANNDYYSFFRMICQGAQFANLPEKLLYYRVHKNNNTFNNIKTKFMNTLKIRFKMINTYGYAPTFKQIMITCIQFFGIMCLPEAVLTRLYLLSKGIIKPSQSIKETISSIRLLFSKKSFITP